MLPKSKTTAYLREQPEAAPVFVFGYAVVNIMDEHAWVSFLRRRLQEPLPGHAAHQRLMPHAPGRQRPLTPPPGSRPAAVLVAFLRNVPSPTCLLTLRSSRLLHHRGEWSFPGGMLHAGEAPEEAAVREATEEIGIVPDQVELLGRATPLYVPASHAAVIPVIAALSPPEEFRLNPEEVEELRLLSLDELAQHPPQMETWSRDGRLLYVPLWRLSSPVPLWGATAMILAELLWLYAEFRHESAARGNRSP
ncbi:putative Nudix hydrolase NudL [bacterium HR21]|nr:putative Nudix hydrolase NudL [bacterium HR21]